VAFVPTGSHNDYDEGAWVSRAAYDGLFDSYKFHSAIVVLRPGADTEEVAARIGGALVDLLDDPAAAENIAAVRPPLRMAELEEVQRLPLFLAAFLAVLAVGAVGHALATAVRRRRHDIAVLRAVGVTRRQCRWMVVTQASLLASFGLLVGIPIGMALGRTLWRTVADSTPVAYVTPVAVWLLVLIIPVSLLIANLLAAWPSQRAASLRVGHVLRAE
jgi:ABC-type antimicrobial peptide transport system permease subunit